MKRIKKFFKKNYILIIIVISIFVGNFIFNKMNEPKEIPFHEFNELVENNEVEEVKIEVSSSNFIFITKNKEEYKTENPRSEGFKKSLLEKEIKVTEISSFNISSYIPLLLQIALIVIVLKSLGNKTSMRKDVKIQEIPKINLNDVILPTEVKNDIETLIDFVKNPKEYEDRGASLPKGAILYGPPGTGKTLIAKAIAGQAGLPFFSLNGSDFVEMYVGVGPKRVRELFKEARALAPCILFIDEFDAIGKKRGQSNNDERDNTINALLAELDGFNKTGGVLTIAATNKIEDLDDALIRPGRFDKRIKISLPMTKEERYEIIKIHSKNKKFDTNIDFNHIAKLTFGFSGAEIQTLINEAAINSILNKHDAIYQDDFNKAFNQIILQGHQNKKINKDKDIDELKRIAYHEAGHAIISKLLCNESISMISIIGTTTGAGGFTISLPENYTILTKKDLENKIKSLYAGRAAEVISGYGISAGASNDIEKATNIIKAMYTEYGMDENYLLNSRILGTNDDKDILNKIKEEGITLYKETETFLKENKVLLDKIMNSLIEKETLDEEDLNRILKKED